MNFFDTADAYGAGRNEQLLAKAMQGRRDQFIIATKFGTMRDQETGKWQGFSGKPEYVKWACERSLQNLGTSYIDLYYLHRVDPNTAIEDTVRAMAELVKEGKVRYLGLSECSAQTLRRACAIHPIAALQTEYSLWTRDVEAEILPACRELGVSLVAYSPLGRGVLTGTIVSSADLEKNDWRHTVPRMQEENLKKNAALIEKLKEFATKKGVSPAQLALAWVLAQGPEVIALPGTRRRKYLLENFAAVNHSLSAEEVKEVNQIVEDSGVAGERYDPRGMSMLNL